MGQRLMIGDFVRVITKDGQAKEVEVQNIDVDGWIVYNDGVGFKYEPIRIHDAFLLNMGFSISAILGRIFILRDDAGKIIMTIDKGKDSCICTYKKDAQNVGKMTLTYINELQQLCHLLGIPLTPHHYE